MYNYVRVKFKKMKKSNYSMHVKNLCPQKDQLFKLFSTNTLSRFEFKKACSKIDHHLMRFLECKLKKVTMNWNTSRLFSLIRNKIRPLGLPALRHENRNN